MAGVAVEDDDERPKRVRMDGAARRRQILKAAGRLFGERPYSAVSVNDIADEAGVAKGLMHHYFGSKRELYLEVVRETAAMPSIPLPEDDDDLDTAQVWERSVNAFLAMVGQHPDLWLSSVTVGGAESDDEVAEILDDSKEVLAAQTLTALGLDDRSENQALRALVRAYGGFVQELTVEWLGRGRLQEEQVRRAMLETLPLLIERILPLLEDD